jgi:hypothetical protein
MSPNKIPLWGGLLVLLIVLGSMVVFMDHGADVQNALLAVGAGSVIAADITRRFLGAPDKEPHEDSDTGQPSLPGPHEPPTA